MRVAFDLRMLPSGVILLLWLVGCQEAPAERAAPTAAPSASSMKAQLEGIRPGEERQLGGGTKMLMHRLQASAPIGDGWHRATSTEGAFSVELPLPFNDFRMRSRTADGIEMRAHTVGGKTAGLLAWNATCLVRRDGKRGPKAPAAGTDEIEVQGAPPKAHTRRIQFDDMACVLVVEAQGTDPLAPEADRLRFLHSFKRTGKPAWR